MVTKREIYNRLLEAELDIADLIIRVEKLEKKLKPVSTKKTTKTTKAKKEGK